jgi:superfamily II DNA/RNA helicase
MMFLYKSRKIDLLVATDILARGIDIDDIRIVINYDVPGDCDDYIHRVGRTARANNTGRGITLVSVNDQQAFGRIEKFIGKPIDKIALPAELGEAPEYNPAKKKPEQGKKRSYGSKGRGGKKGDSAQKAKPAKKNGAKAESGNSTAPAPAEQQPMQQSTQAAPSQEAAPKKRRRYYGKKKGSGSKPTATPEAGK